MKLYRLTQKKHSTAPFSPIGAKLFGGRWNSKGAEALYFSESESLCSLEVFVHVNNDPNIAKKYDLYRIDIPKGLIVKLDHHDLPSSWRAIPASARTQEIGDEFLNNFKPQFAALQIPSAISPRDKNYLVNPNHPAMEQIFKEHEKLNFEFDLRIFK